MKQAKLILIGNTWYVQYPTSKPELCHNRATAAFLAQQFNTQSREANNGLSK